MGEQPLGEHVRPVGRVHLAVDRERQLAGHLLDGDRGAFALLEEAQPSLAQEVPVAGRLHLRCDPVEPAGERLPVPGSGGGEPEGAEAARERQRQDPGAREEGREELGEDRGHEGGLDPEPRDQPEPGRERAEDVAAGIRRVDRSGGPPGLLRRVVRGGGGARHRQREGGAERQAGKQQHGGGPEELDVQEVRHVAGVPGDEFSDGKDEAAPEPGHAGRGGRSQELDGGQPETRAAAVSEPRRRGAAERDAEDHRGDDAGEGVDGGAEEQRGEPRPADLGGHRREPGERRDAAEGKERPAAEPRGPDGVARSRSRRPSEPAEDQHPGGDVRRDPAQRGPAESQFGDEQPGRRHAAGEGAGGVRGIEPAGRASFAAVAEPPRERRQRRQRGAHQGGGGKQEQRRENGGEQERPRARIREPRQRERPPQIQRQPRREARGADLEQQESPGQPRRAQPSPRTSGEQRAEPEPPEEHREDQRQRGVRGAEHHRETPQPDDLVGEGGEAREQQREREERYGRRIGRGSRAPGCRAPDGVRRTRGLSPPAPPAGSEVRNRGGPPPERLGAPR